MPKGEGRKINPYAPNLEFDLPIADQPILAASAYRGNAHLRPAGIPVEMTPQQLREYIRCMNDVNYFAERYIKIIDVDKGLIDFKPYKYQQKMMKTFSKQRFSVVMAPRQSGKCLLLNTKIRLKDRNGKIFEVSGEHFYAWLRFKRDIKRDPSVFALWETRRQQEILQSNV